MASTPEPVIIQGGMGVAVSGWQLARAVSLAGQLGVVSGTALDVVMARRLQLGDEGGHVRRAVEAFPFPDMAERVLDRYFVAGGKDPHVPFVHSPVLRVNPPPEQLELVVIGNFVEVFLAKEKHDGRVGINYLEKIQPPTLASLFGAMLAGVDYVLMGAGIPRAIPGILDQLSQGQAVELPLSVLDAGPNDRHVCRFDPIAFTGDELPWLDRPKFLAIIASATLATMLHRKASGRIDGFVVEGPTAGGHNAPPRGELQLNERGEPIYGPRDVVDLDAIAALGLPFWLAGSYGSPERLVQALKSGATGIQVGTAFAFCEESGLPLELKRRVLQMGRDGQLDVFTDPVASPTGFPFKVLSLQGTLSQANVYEQRRRRCDLGFLRQAFQKADGTLGWRCPAEPLQSYLHKGGQLEETHGCKCVCNGLLANIGLGQLQRNGQEELPLFTCGDEVREVPRFLPSATATSYSAQEVIDCLLSAVKPKQRDVVPVAVQAPHVARWHVGLAAGAVGQDTSARGSSSPRRSAASNSPPWTSSSEKSPF